MKGEPFGDNVALVEVSNDVRNHMPDLEAIGGEHSEPDDLDVSHLSFLTDNLGDGGQMGQSRMEPNSPAHIDDDAPAPGSLAAQLAA